MIDLASENSKLRDELDTALKSKETSEAKSQEQLQARKDEIDDLRAQLLGLESERIRYFNKCQELEQQLHEDESRFYRDLNGRPTVDTTGQDRVQHRIVQEARDSSQVNSLFNQLDATTSILCHSQVAADTLSKHAKNMDIYQSNIVAMYEQLKHTAKFLADIVHSLGLDNSQIELLMQKISQLQLDMSETHEMSRRIATETRRKFIVINKIALTFRSGKRDVCFERISRGQHSANQHASDFCESFDFGSGEYWHQRMFFDSIF